MGLKSADVKQLLLQVDAATTLAQRNIRELAAQVAGDSAAMNRSLKTIDDGVDRTGMAFGKLNSLAGAFGITLGAGAFLAAGRSILQMGDDLEAVAEQAGMGIERFQTLKEALRTLEIDGDKTDKIFKALQATLGDVQNGADSGATQALDRLGVKAQILNGTITTSDQLLDALAAASKGAGTQAQFTADLVDVFGKKIGVDLAAALADGGTALHTIEEDFRKTGLVISEAMVQRLAEANESIDRFSGHSSRALVLFAANAVESFERIGYKLRWLGRMFEENMPGGDPAGFQRQIELYERSNLDQLRQSQTGRVTAAENALRRGEEESRRGSYWERNGYLGQGPGPSLDQLRQNLNRERQELRRLQGLRPPTPAEETPAASATATRRIAARGDAGGEKGLTAFGAPVPGRPSSGFGPRSSPGGVGSKYHLGVDYPVATGTAVRAPAMGVVEAIGFSPELGKYVVIDHGAGTKTRFGHLSNNQVVRQGDVVRAGEVIARSGNTGTRTTGPHLHYEVISGGKRVDPGKGRFRIDTADAYGDYVDRPPPKVEEVLRPWQELADALPASIENFDLSRPLGEVRELEDVLGDVDGLLGNMPIPNLADMLPTEEREQLLGFAQDFRRDLSRGLAEAAIYGDNLGDVLENVFKRAAVAMIESGILNFLSGGKQGTSFGTMLSNIGTIVGGSGLMPGASQQLPGQGSDIAGMLDFGKTIANLPGRAIGGQVWPGQAYLVGERGPEPFVPKVPGTIFPAGGRAQRDKPEAIHVTVEASEDFQVKVATTSAAVVQAAAPGISSQAAAKAVRLLLRPQLPGLG